jgi:hypothetical protein
VTAVARSEVKIVKQILRKMRPSGLFASFLVFGCGPLVAAEKGNAKRINTARCSVPEKEAARSGINMGKSSVAWDIARRMILVR